MNRIFGIRREDKNEWEARVPIVPDDAARLLLQNKIQAVIQPSKIRAIKDDDFALSGVKVDESLASCPLILAVKEIPEAFFERGKTYAFFSHTIKGQKYNMPMLKKMMDMECNLVDYERVADSRGVRLIFFGRWAGIAGMIDTLWAFGQRLYAQGIKTPFYKIKKAVDYKNLDDAKREIAKIGDEIKIYGFDQRLVPITCAFLGYGNVSKGAQEIFDLLPHEYIRPCDLPSLKSKPSVSRNVIYKLIYKEEDLVEPTSGKFNLKDYYANPDRYVSKFSASIEHLSLIVNCIYWDPRYPKMVTKEYLRKLFGSGQNQQLKVIGDITCDVEGSIECTIKTTNPGDPVFAYDPLDDKIEMGYSGRGVVVLAVDNLPCELPVDSSKDFSRALAPFVPAMIEADWSADFDNLKLPDEIKRAVILHRGKLTPDYEYMKKYL